MCYNTMRIIIESDLVIILICLYTVQNIKGLDAVRLSDLKVKQTAIINKVNHTLDGEAQTDLVASRLETLGFVAGTKVQVITKGVFGGDPILIQVGFTRFALRKVEAEKIEIQVEGAPRCSDALRVALVGNPNCGKTSLFNHLTGTRQKVGNYAGVTVERKVGQFTLPSGQAVRVLDLPGTYSLDATSPDEMITRDVVMGKLQTKVEQDAFLCVVDATNLKLHLGLVIELIALGRPMLIVLNMMDEARRRGMQINTQKLSERLGVPIVETVAVRNSGIESLLQCFRAGQICRALYRVDGLKRRHCT